MMQAQQILEFWFGTERDDLAVMRERGSLWFSSKPELDQTIRERFGALLQDAQDGKLDAWTTKPHGRLALVILLDQFSRNIHRGTGQAFGADAQALQLCREGIAQKQHTMLRPIERCFLFMPLMHAEDLAAQDQAVALFEELQAQATGELANNFASNVKYAREHRDLIAKFGRFPHRNAVLKRESTPAEQTYLAGKPNAYGQTPSAP